LNEGKAPFTIDYDGKLPLDEFKDPRGAQFVPYDKLAAKKGVRYRGRLTVEWGEAEVRLLREQAKQRQR
jgi:hypothetical protein